MEESSGQKLGKSALVLDLGCEAVSGRAQQASAES